MTYRSDILSLSSTRFWLSSKARVLNFLTEGLRVQVVPSEKNFVNFLVSIQIKDRDYQYLQETGKTFSIFSSVGTMDIRSQAAVSYKSVFSGALLSVLQNSYIFFI